MGNGATNATDPSGLEDVPTSVLDSYLDMSPQASELAATDAATMEAFATRHGTLGMQRLEQVIAWGWSLDYRSVYRKKGYEIEHDPNDGSKISIDTKWGYLWGTLDISPEGKADALWSAINDEAVDAPKGWAVDSEGGKHTQAGDSTAWNGKSQLQSYGAVGPASAKLLNDAAKEGAIEAATGPLPAGILTKGDDFLRIANQSRRTRLYLASVPDGVRIARQGGKIAYEISDAYRKASKGRIYQRINRMKGLMTEAEKARTTFAAAEVVQRDIVKSCVLRNFLRRPPALRR